MHIFVNDFIARDEKEKETVEKVISQLTFREKVRLFDFLVPIIESKLDKVVKAEKGSGFSYCERFFYKNGVFFTRICSKFYDGITPSISEIALSREDIILSDDELDKKIEKKAEEERLKKIAEEEILKKNKEEEERRLYLRLKEKYGE